MFDNRTPQQTSSSAQAKKQEVKQRIVMVLIGAAIFLSAGTVFRFFNIFARYETVIYILLLSSPLGIFFYRRAEKRLQSLFSNQPKYSALIIFTALYGISVVISVLSLNIFMDNSMADKKTYTVTDKYIYSHKGSKTYYADITRPDFVQTLFQFSNTESIRITRDEYDRLLPNVTRIGIFYHTGMFGFPWYEDVYTLDNLSTITPTPPQPSYESISSAIREACLWKLNFNLDAEIEKISPDNFFRDFWENGNPRSVEPMVNGQRHGIAHYTFADGKVYADIPWKYGQKHGVFTLYREDGTNEQTLSYKNGELYGIQEWYNRTGGISRTYLYLGNGNGREASVCAQFTMRSY